VPGRRNGCARQACSRPARRPSPGLTPAPPGCGRGEPRCAPWAGAGSAQPRPRSTHTPRSPPLASYLRPGLRALGGDGLLITLSGRWIGTCGGVTHAVQQTRGAAQGIADMEQPKRSAWSPGPASTADPDPTPRGRATIQRTPNRANCSLFSRHTAPPGPFETRAASPAARQRRRH
jgi:hypothetical protein